MILSRIFGEYVFRDQKLAILIDKNDSNNSEKDANGNGA